MEEKTRETLKKYGPWATLGVVILLLLVSFVGAYNGLVASDEAVQAQGKQVDVSYQRAFALLPQLTDVVEQFMANETDLIAKATELRSGLTEAEDGTLNAKDSYSAEVFDFVALVGNRVEAYPELQSKQLYLDLMSEMTNTQNKIAAEKNRYNDRVQEYNAEIRTCCMPKLAASMFGFEAAEYIGYDDRPNTEDWSGT